MCVCVCVCVCVSASCPNHSRTSYLTADTDSKLSEDDGWEFVTLADQVTGHMTNT